MPFMAVHHFSRKHAMTSEGILRYDPSLADAVDEFFGRSARPRTRAEL